MLSKTSSPVGSMHASNIGIKSRDNTKSPTKEAPALDSIDSERIMRTVHGSIERLEQNTVKKMLEVKVVPKIRLKDQK